MFTRLIVSGLIIISLSACESFEEKMAKCRAMGVSVDTCYQQAKEDERTSDMLGTYQYNQDRRWDSSSSKRK